jgi:hypothetical protein
VSIYDSLVWKTAAKLLPQRLRLRIRIPVLKAISRVRALLLHSYSANGEDRVVSKLIGNQPIWWFDLGSGDPVIHSNTYKFYLDGNSGVGIDANRHLVKSFLEQRSRDQTIWGAVSLTGGAHERLTFFELDPWELSTVSVAVKDAAIQSGARLVEDSEVPVVDVGRLLGQCFPFGERRLKTLLNVDLEGLSYECLKLIDLTVFSFDFLLVESDDEIAGGSIVDRGFLDDLYELVAKCGPTDIWTRRVITFTNQ